MEIIRQLYRSPLLRRSLRRVSRKTGRFLRDVLPDILVIAVSVFIIMQIWEWCFWR